MPKNDKPQISIIILNYNGEELLKTFLPSVFNLSYPNYEVIVVDNASTDESVSYLKQHFPEARLVISDKNLGWGAGNNLGGRHARGKYLWFLNNDVKVAPDSLNELVNFMQSSDGVGLCVPFIYYYLDKEVVYSAGHSLNRFGQTRAIGQGKRERPPLSRPYCVTYASGCALLLRRNLYNALGGFDEDIFLGSDDIDISLRCWLQGFKVALVPSSTVYHVLRASSGKAGDEARAFRSISSTLLVMLKNLQLTTLLTAIPSYLGICVITGLFNLLVRARLSYISALFKAVAFNLRLLPRTMGKRRILQRGRKLTDRKILNLAKDVYKGKVYYANS